jgi:hypothetical protein
MKIKNLFTEDVQKILTPESLEAIEQAFEDKVALVSEMLLKEQDELYAEKLITLIKTIDKDHTGKMRKLIEAVDKGNASKLVKIVKLYERDSKRDAKKFKKELIGTVSAYLDTFINESIDQKDFTQAVKNNTAYNVLENLRNVLGVDTAMMNPEIQNAVLDGKSQIDKLTNENVELKKQYKALYEAHQKNEVSMLLENKTAKLPTDAKNFVRKALQDKSLKFIEENFDYTLRLFEKQEKSKLVTLKEDALNRRTVKPDVVPVQKVVEESLNNDEHGDMYVDVLSKTWGGNRKS